MPDASTHIYTGLPGNWMNWMFWCGSHLYSKQIQNIQHIQDDSSGNFNILGGDSIGHCEKNKSTYEQVSNSVWLPRYSCLNQQIQKHCDT